MNYELGRKLPVAVTVRVSTDGVLGVRLEEARSFSLYATGEGKSWVDGYLRGEPGELPRLVWPEMSKFTRDVLECMAQIPFGKTMTYGELAMKAGYPKAARAVGTVCNKNPFPLMIPCHRVVSSSGLGGFAFGTSLKAALLEHESGNTSPIHHS